MTPLIVDSRNNHDITPQRDALLQLRHSCDSFSSCVLLMKEKEFHTVSLLHSAFLNTTAIIRKHVRKGNTKKQIWKKLYSYNVKMQENDTQAQL